MNDIKIGELKRALDYALYDVEGLVSLFAHKSDSLIENNRTRVEATADSVIRIMEELKSALILDKKIKDSHYEVTKINIDGNLYCNDEVYEFRKKKDEKYTTIEILEVLGEGRKFRAHVKEQIDKGITEEKCCWLLIKERYDEKFIEENQELFDYVFGKEEKAKRVFRWSLEIK